MVVLKKILVATDFSEPSSVALAYGRDMARAYGATIHLLHVVDDATRRYRPELGFALGFDLADLQKDMEAARLRDLDGLITPDDRQTLAIVTAVEMHLNVAQGITAYARAHDIDLIIVGTHGRGAVTQFLMGSAAERVVRTAPCPVLAVRAHERDFIAPEATVGAATA